MALTRPKTPKKEQSGSPGGSNHSRQQSESSLRSPISDIAVGATRSITKTPNIHTVNDSGSGNDVKIPQSPLPPSEKLNHHTNDNSHNNNGVSQQQRDQQQQQQQFTASHAINGPDKILPSPSVDRKDFDFSKVNGEFFFIFHIVHKR